MSWYYFGREILRHFKNEIKKVLLRNRKRRTALCVAQALTLLSGGWGTLFSPGGYPILSGGTTILLGGTLILPGGVPLSCLGVPLARTGVPPPPAGPGAGLWTGPVTWLGRTSPPLPQKGPGIRNLRIPPPLPQNGPWTRGHGVPYPPHIILFKTSY